MNDELNYLPYNTPTLDRPLWWHTQGLSQTASGYGRKLVTPRKALHNGRYYRVYATCFSTSTSALTLAPALGLVS